MEKVYIHNTMHMTMLPRDVFKDRLEVRIEHLKRYQARSLVHNSDCLSILRHRNLSRLISRDLDLPLEFLYVEGTRTCVNLSEDDKLLVCSYTGPKLGYGDVPIPENTMLQYYLVYFVKRGSVPDDCAEIAPTDEEVAA